MALVIIVVGPISAVLGAETQRAKRVLMLFSEGKDVPGNVLVERGARDVLLHSGRAVEFYAEYLDTGRFLEENHYRLFREYLQAKYAQRPPDLVMPFLARKFEVAGQLPADLFPTIPVVFGALTEAEIPRAYLGSNVTGVVQRLDVQGALGIILKVQPDTKRIVVIGGTAPLDRLYLAITEKAARSLSERVQFDFWTTRPVAEMREAVASLPPHTVIFFTTVFRDAAGETFFPEQVASLLAMSSNVPIYVPADPMIGSGVVGGKVSHLEAVGRRVGELAQRVLDGTPPAALPIEVRTQGVPMFDWRALKRWGISESRLPPGSIVRFRQPSLWEQYQWYIIGALNIFVLQTALIVALLLHRAHRRRAEADLLESEQRMSLAARAANLGVWMWDVQRDDVWITPEGRRFFGWENSEPINLARFLDTLYADDRDGVRQAINRSLERGDPYLAEYRVREHDGTYRWISAQGEVEFDGARRPLRMRGVAIDITRRKRAEERFRLAVEASPSAVVMVDQQGQIILVNSLTEKLFGYSRGELIGQSVELLVPERFRSLHPAQRIEFFAAPQARTMGTGRDLFARRKDGSEFLVEIGLNPIQTTEGPLVLTAIVDITERKRAEAELQRNREALAHVTRVSTVGELTAAVAHELNQPLGAILSNAEAAEMFLKMEPPALDEVRDILADIRKDDQRASEVIRRMRSLLRKQEMTPQPVEINAAVEEALKLLSVNASAQKVMIRFERTADLARVWCDPVHLQQLLLNLVLNGMEAMAEIPEEQRQVTVRTLHGDNGTVKVSVSDRGPGIPNDKLAKLFEPFFTTKKDGMGMGLSIARTIVEAHHGQVWADNDPCAGATFYFTLPVSKHGAP